MSDKHQQESNSQALPFFARYLEAQFCEDLSEEEMEEVQGGLRYAAPPTRKHPPESPDGIAITLKYPSDREDVGITSKRTDLYEAVTKKYPSDNDEHIAVTLKYPSDGDDDVKFRD
jgi:hypothetical protein